MRKLSSYFLLILIMKARKSIWKTLYLEITHNSLRSLRDDILGKIVNI
jgi:hypothetical protein